MNFIHSHWFYTLMAMLTSFALTYIAIPSIIHISNVKNLFDDPNERKAHTVKIPNLGGIAIFGGFIIALAIWSDMEMQKLIQYILAGSCLIFLVGAKDDIVEMSPRKKFFGQFIATMIVVILGGLRFTSFHDLFPGFQVPEVLGIIITVFTILVIINAFNLIDGINALSGSVGIVIATALGVWFWLDGDYQMVVLAAALVGALLAFLRYNVSPASIFMGDTGSLLIGFICAVMTIYFVEQNIGQNGVGHFVNAAPGVSIGFLALPLFDLLRAFSIRIMEKRSPFSPDRNHLHHMLLDCGLSHMQSTGILVLLQVFYIGAVLFLQKLGINSWLLIGALLSFSIIVAFIISRVKSSKGARAKRIKVSKKQQSNSFKEHHLTPNKIKSSGY